MASDEIKPFQISIPESQLSDLKERLARVRYPDELEDAGWENGVPLAEAQRLTKYWAESFDWRKAEARLNEFPHFTTDLQADGFETLTVHFIHQRSSSTDEDAAVPLLYLHGWPGSFYEGTKIIQPLAQGSGGGGGSGGEPSFHVVAPSLVNFGFSQGTRKRGFSIQHQAEIMHKLMLRLGYQRYAVQGGDWGWFVARALSLRYPDHAVAQHLNLDLASPPTWTQHPFLALKHAVTPYTPREKTGLARMELFKAQGSGYNAVQGTRPQTLGYGLADSPAGLLAWIYEKLREWTDDYAWTDDEVCTWISIYWFSTAGPTASWRLYHEFFSAHAPGVRPGAVLMSDLQRWQPRVKIGLARFPMDVAHSPHIWGHTLGDVVFEKTHESGGHFPVWECPDAVIADLREMFAKGKPARKAVGT